MPILPNGVFIPNYEVSARIKTLQTYLKVAEESNNMDHPAAIEWSNQLEMMEGLRRA